MSNIDLLKAIRERYHSMVGLRNDAGAPSQQEADIRDLLRLLDEAALEMKRRKMHGTEIEFKDLPVHLQLHSLDKAVRRLDEEVAALRKEVNSRRPIGD